MIALRRGEWLEEVARCVCGQLERAIIVCVVGSRTAKCTLKLISTVVLNTALTRVNTRGVSDTPAVGAIDHHHPKTLYLERD